MLSRREALAGLGLLAVSSATKPAFAQTPAPARADNWPQFRGNPRLTGVATSVLPATPKLLWSYDTGDVIDSSAAIAGNTVYVGAGDGHLVALDLVSGALRWKYAAGMLIGESSPTVSGNIAYIGDMDGNVHGVNTADGTRVWIHKTGGEIKASPIVVRDTMIIGSYDTHLYALEARTGRVRWKVETKGPVHATPAVLGDLVFVAGCDSMFRAIRHEWHAGVPDRRRRLRGGVTRGRRGARLLRHL